MTAAAMAAAAGLAGTRLLGAHVGRGGLEGAAHEMGDERIGGKGGGILDRDDADFQKMLLCVGRKLPGDDHFHLMAAEETGRAGAGGIGEGLAAEILDGAGFVVDVVKGESARGGEAIGDEGGLVGFGAEGDGDSHGRALVKKWLNG